MNHRFFFLSALFSVLIIACSSKNDPDKVGTAQAQTSTNDAGENHLSMKINGVEWKADNNIFGAFHPKGYDKAIMIAGSKGPKNKNEQPFNINLYNADGPGVFQIREGNPDLNVAQLANMSPENYMYGSLMGFNMKVTVTKASTNPDVIEATFEGDLNGNAGDVLKITEGKFYYHE